MWLQINKANVGFVFFITTAFLSLNVMAEDNEAAIRTESKVFESWQLVCNYGKNNQKLGCAAILKITQENSARKGSENPHENVAMLWTFSKSKSDSFISTIQTPTGVVIKPGARLRLPVAKAEATFAYISCGKQTCFAGAEMDDDFLKKIASEQKVDIVIQSIDSKVYTYSFSPKGIDQAIQAIK